MSDQIITQPNPWEKTEEESKRPPPFPWEKGVQKEYTCFSLELQICQENSGEVWSMHSFASPKDEEIASKVHSEGLEQMVVSLFTESVRREAYLQALIKETQEEGFLERFKKEGPKGDAEKELRESVGHVSRSLVSSLVEGAVQEILGMLVEGGS